MCDTGKALDFSASLVRDQENGGSNPLAPTTLFRISDLTSHENLKSAWSWDRRSLVKRTSRLPIAES